MLGLFNSTSSTELCISQYLVIYLEIFNQITVVEIYAVHVKAI